tara:strand:- start:40 stop:804 length:765 start_codon:yes stop_codon:yes gene_type:complete
MTKDRKFEGVWIPRGVWLSKNLTLQEKVLLTEINSLDNDKGCFASNSYFSEFFDLSRSRISQIIKSLTTKKYIKVRLIYEGKAVKKRVINILTTPVTNINLGGENPKEGGEELRRGYLGNASDNSTVNNTDNSTVIITMPPNKNLVEDCLNNCLEFFPEHLHPKNKNTWLDTIEKLNRIDGVPFLEIERIVKATREDPFWGKNFLSMTKLRKKKDEVYYIVIFGEKFKPKEITHNRQTEEVIKKNLTGWGKKQN